MNFRSRIILTGSVFVFFTIFAPFGHMPSDTKYSLATAKSMVHGKLSIGQSPHFPHAVKGINGNYYSKYGIGYAVLFLPPVLVSECISLIYPLPERQLHQAIAALTSTLIATVCIFLFVIIIEKLGFSKMIITLSVLLTASGSVLLPYSKISHAEMPTTLLLLLFISHWQTCTKLTFKKGSVIGFCIAGLLLLKASNVPNAAIIFACGLYLVLSKRSTKSGTFILLTLPSVTLLFLLYLNAYRYGSPFNSGYGAEQQQFTTPLINGLAGLLCSPSKSIFIFSPLLIVSFIGFFSSFSSHRRLCITIGSLFIFNLFFYALWHDWHGGWAWGPRFMVPVIIMMYLFLPFFLNKTVFSLKFMKKQFIGNDTNHNTKYPALPNNSSNGTLTFFFNSIVNCYNKLMHSWLIRRWRTVLLLFLIPPSIVINCLGALIWYQQIYYFHKDHTSIQHSHPAIALKLFVHKLENKPEVYLCSSFFRDCSKAPYNGNWKKMIQGNTIDFRDYETFLGFSTIWGALWYRTKNVFYLIIPLFLFGVSIGGINLVLHQFVRHT